MTTLATISGAARRDSCTKLRRMGYKCSAAMSVADVCALIVEVTGRPYPLDPVRFMIQFATETEGQRATSPAWNCMARPAYTMDRQTQIAAVRARKTL